MQIELSSSSGAGMMASWAHRPHIVVHQLVPHNSLKQHMQYSSQQQAAGNKVTRVYYKVLQQHAAFAWLQVRGRVQGQGSGFSGRVQQQPCALQHTPGMDKRAAPDIPYHLHLVVTGSMPLAA